MARTPKRPTSVVASTWQDAALPLEQRARALVDACNSRGDVKRLGGWLDASGSPALRGAVRAVGEARGVDFPSTASELPGKRLLRLARGQEQSARERSNPIARDEAFTCAACGKDVPPHGRTARDHCPWCLCSLHVDRVPGDRAAGCGGILDPVSAETRGDDVVMHYRCRVCGQTRTNRALLDGAHPDDWSQVTRVASRGGSQPR